MREIVGGVERPQQLLYAFDMRLAGNDVIDVVRINVQRKREDAFVVLRIDVCELDHQLLFPNALKVHPKPLLIRHDAPREIIVCPILHNRILLHLG